MSAHNAIFNYLRKILFIFTLLYLTLGFSKTVQAQGFNASIAVTYLATEPVESGDIVSLQENGKISRSTRPFDEKLLGVVTDPATIVLRKQNDGIAVVRSDYASVKVSTLNGPIEKGDYITSSSIAGVGQLSTDPTGIILGIALEPFTEKDGNPLSLEGQEIRVGQIPVNIHVGPPVGGLLKRSGPLGFVNQLSRSLLGNLQKPEGTALFFRYLIAGLVAIITIAISFTTFGRNITRGIESIGRNPLARLSIQSMIITNAILIAVISIGGILLSLIILRF